MSQLTDTFTSIADAIRYKTGGSSSFTPAQMPSEIINIPTGGSWIGVNEYRESTITSYTGNEKIILDNAFMNCSNLSEVSFPECEYIGFQAFNTCSNLTTASFTNVSYIGSSAFSGCSGLTAISSPICEYIGSNAFSSCTSLSEAIFPNCSYIGNVAFYSCNTLSNISFPNASYIGSNTFGVCSSLSEAIFPNCTYIGNYAFQSCISLTNMSFPNISYIGSNAFKNCTSLSWMYLLSTSVVSLANSNAFSYTPLSAGGTGTIYVPSSLYNSYITANKWSALSARISSM